MAEKSSWDQANSRQKHGLVLRNRNKISQIIKDYFYLPFFLLIILWLQCSPCNWGRQSILWACWVWQDPPGGTTPVCPSLLLSFLRVQHGLIHYKDTTKPLNVANPKRRLYWCLINWKYSQSCWYIFDRLCDRIAPLTFSLVRTPTPP